MFCEDHSFAIEPFDLCTCREVSEAEHRNVQNGEVDVQRNIRKTD